MNFCDELCCYGEFCNNQGKFDINFSRYHKICHFHLPYISPQSEITCSYCNSVCRVIEEVLEKSKKSLPLCFICKQEYTYNEFTNIGYNCYVNRRCPTCHHITRNVEDRINCGHKFCNMCKSSCILCDAICLGCSKIGYEIHKSNCGHNMCLDCYNKECNECKKILMCTTCERLDFYQKDFASHYQCYSCRTKEEPCPSCKNFSKVFIRSCGHMACSFCDKSPCSLCIPCFKCKIPSILYQKNCQHSFCNSCYPENCPACCPIHKIEYSILSCSHFYYCQQCNQNQLCPTCTSAMALNQNPSDSSHDEEKALNSNSNNNLTHNEKNLGLPHEGQLTIQSNLPEFTNLFSYDTVRLSFTGSNLPLAKNLKGSTQERHLPLDEKQLSCPNCGKDAACYTLECLHQGCMDCPNKKKCFECERKTATCKNCKKKIQTRAVFLCGHYACSKCIKSFCKSCNQNEEKSSCIECSKPKKLCKVLKNDNSTCYHKFCSECALKQKNNCKFCEMEQKCEPNQSKSKPQYCEFCGLKINFNNSKNKCEHTVCEACSNPCTLCSEICPNCKKHVIQCSICKKLKCENKQCKFGLCNYCEFSNELKNECFKCKEYSICKKCKSCYNSLCIECSASHNCQDFYNPICLSCGNPTKNITNCPHYFCQGCFNSQGCLCPICNSIESKCKTCFLIGFKKFKFECNHLGCGSCFKNSFACYICIFEQKVSKVFKNFDAKMCSECEEKHMRGVYLMCGHFVCKKCSCKDWREVNYWCIGCNISLRTKRNCFLCKSEAHLEIRQEKVIKKCCGYSVSTEDFKMMLP